jgi:hypothetical protein
MSKSLKGVEIFAVGSWKGNKRIEVTSDDLDSMVHSFEQLSAVVQGYSPMLKLGHTDQQKFFPQSNGAPSLGIVERIWRQGDKVLADFGNVPAALLALVEKRRYNAVSIEMYPTVEHGGQTFKNVLTAVALLGAELPAVKGLKELADSLSFKDQELVFGEGVLTFQQETETVFTQDQVDALIAAAVTKATDAAKAEFTAEKTAITARVEAAEAEATKFKGERDASQKALFDFEQSASKAEITRLVEDAVKSGTILPKDKDKMIALGESMTNKVKLGDKEVSGAEAFADLIGSMGKKVDLSEKGAGSQEQASNAGLEIDKRARQKISAAGGEDKMSYADARKIVLNEDPDLKERYAKMGQE